MTAATKRGLGAVIFFGLLACALYGVGAGIRGDIGILLMPISRQTGLDYASVSFCIAVMQLVFGAAQPVFGVIANRFSNRAVLMLGAVTLAASLVGISLSHGFWSLFISLGVLFGIGGGALAFGLILTSAIYFVGQHWSMVIAGMLNASAGLGAFALSPALAHSVQDFGLQHTLWWLSVPVVALLPLAWVITSRDPKKSLTPEIHAGGSLWARAAKNRTFILLVAGFSTCGFHMVIIESHLFSQYVGYGIEPDSASWAFAFYGIATIVGALLSGFLSMKVHKGRLLGTYYALRVLLVVIFLFLLPKTFMSALIFSIGLGLTGDATVSPTSGLVSSNFRIRDVATLVGFLFFCHQIGAFLSAWLGGVLLHLTHGYTAVWGIDIALCVFASAVSFLIRDDGSAPVAVSS